jgi:hypothetical protein
MFAGASNLQHAGEDISDKDYSSLLIPEAIAARIEVANPATPLRGKILLGPIQPGEFDAMSELVEKPN